MAKYSDYIFWHDLMEIYNMATIPHPLLGGTTMREEPFKTSGPVPPERESRIGEITNRVRNSNKTLYVLNEKLQNIIQNAEGPTPEVDSSASNKIEPCGSLGTLSMEVEVTQNLLCEIEQRIEYIERLL